MKCTLIGIGYFFEKVREELKSLHPEAIPV
jgi:hypothetical protein